MEDKSILLTIAARGGSKGVKNKNLRELCGKPLIAHTITQAIRWGKADKIICSTDSEEIAEVAKTCGAEVPFMRPHELATDNAGKIGVLQHAVSFVEKEYNKQYKIIVDLDVTAPIRAVDDIDKALQLFLKKRPNSLMSATPCRKNPYFNMVEEKPDGFFVLSKKTDKQFVRRQDAPRVYDVNASIYVYNRDFLLDPKTKTPLSDKTMIYQMDALSAFDIDHESDFQFIEFLVSKGMVKL